MNRIALVLRKKWAEYLLEILVIMIGVMGAFALDKWNESRKERVEEKKLLSEIRVALNKDLTDQFDRLIERSNQDSVKFAAILERASSGTPIPEEIVNPYRVITAIGGRNLSPHITAYKLLENRGIDIIRSDSLKMAILDIYIIHYTRVEEVLDNIKKNIYDYGRPFARTQFSYNESRDLQPLNETKLMQNIEFINTVGVLFQNNDQILSDLERVRDIVQSVIDLIDRELARL